MVEELNPGTAAGMFITHLIDALKGIRQEMATLTLAINADHVAVATITTRCEGCVKRVETMTDDLDRRVREVEERQSAIKEWKDEISGGFKSLKVMMGIVGAVLTMANVAMWLSKFWPGGS